MKKITLVIFITINAFNASSQTTWEKLFSFDWSDVFRCVREVPSGGYVAAGYVVKSLANDTDAFVARLNASGDTLWTFTYNTSNNGEDLFYKVLAASDGGFLALGYTKTTSGGDDILYVKLNSSGNLQWAKTFSGSQKERGQDVVEVSDGYTIAGYTTSSPAHYYDAIILHIDFNGTTLWNKVIGGNDYDDANVIKKIPGGGYILGGQSASGPNFSQYLIRTNSSGDTIWTKHLTTSTDDNIESLALINNGFILAGSTHDTADDGYLVATDTSGNVQWTKTFGGSDQDDFHTVEVTNDGGFILAGTTSSSGPANPNMWLVKTDAQGNLTWEQTFGGDNHDHGYSAIQTSDGGYIVAGHSGSFGFHNEEAYLVKLGSSGARPNALTYVTAYELLSPTCAGPNSQVKVVVWNFGNNSVSNVNVTVDITGALTQTLTGTVAHLNPGVRDTLAFSPSINTVGGATYTFNAYTSTTNDVYPQRNSFTLTETLQTCNGIEDLQTQLGFSVYPNPAGELVTLDFSSDYKNAGIQLFNSSGEIIDELILGHTSGIKQNMSIANLSSGIYFLKVTTGEGYDLRKIVKF